MVARLYTLKKIRWTLTRQDALTLFKSTILPYLDQGNPFYVFTYQNSLNSLQTLQNRALRIVYKRREWSGTDQAHNNSRLLNAKWRWIFFPLKHGHFLSYNPQNMKFMSKHTLRSNNNLYLKTTLPKTRKYKKSFTFQSLRLWNQQSEDF